MYKEKSEDKYVVNPSGADTGFLAGGCVVSPWETQGDAGTLGRVPQPPCIHGPPM